MSGSKRLCLFSLVIISSFFNLLLIGSSNAYPPTTFVINGPSQMSINQTATLTVSGGCGGPYHWSIIGGGYLSSTVGDSVNYTSPQSNPNCNNNSIISVTDQAEQIVYKRIAVNSSDITTIAYAKKIGCFNHGEYHCAYGNYHCCMFDLYNCMGSLMGWLAYSSGGDCCGTNPSGATCDFQSLCSSAPDLLDKRTSTDISNGCCPDATLPPPPAPVTVSSCTVCDLQVSDFSASPATFTAGNGSTTLAGSIFSSSSFSWTLMIAGKTFSGTDNSFSVTWDGTNSIGQLVHAGTYTATLTVNSDDDPSCSITKSIDIYVNVNCDLQITDFNASPQTFTPGSGSTIFTGDISSSSPFNWILGIAGKSFNGYGSPASAEWDGSNLAGNFVEPGTYTASLSATSQYDNSCVATKTTNVSVVKNCDLLAELNIHPGVPAVIDRDGLVVISGSVSSSKPFSWQLTIDGREISSSSSSSFSLLLYLKYEDFKKLGPKKYKAILTATPEDRHCPPVEKSIEFKVTAREKDCKLIISAESSLNILSGNLSHSQNLFTVPNSGLMSDFTLYYNSMEGYSGVLGTGWTHTYNVFLSTDPTDDAYILSDGRGGMISLYKNGNYYKSDISVYPMLQVNADGTFTLTYKNGTVYHFNTNGKLTAITDKNGNTVNLSYSSGGNLVSITDPAGKVIYLSYDGNNRISAITDPNNNSHAFAYSGDTLTSVSSHNSLGTQTWQYTYDNKAFMLTKTDPDGHLVQYSYDSEYRVSQTIDPQGYTRNIQYDPENSTTTVTEKDGGVWVYKYDPSLGALLSKTDPAGGTTRYQYDSNRNLTTRIEADGTSTNYTYDGSGNMTSVTDALNNTATYTYNEQNQVTGITDATGKQTQYSYDASGNILATTDPSGSKTRYTYDSQGNIIAITDPAGGVTQMAYDSNNNLISITDPTGKTTTQTYDNLGNMISQTDAAGNQTRFQYNSLNQLVAVTDSAGKITRYIYDTNGNRLSVTDANGNTTTYEYNYKNQLIKTTDAQGETTTFSYGAGGCSSCGGGSDKLTAVTDANNQTTSYQYDQLGRLIKETDPLGNSTTYAYDAKGNMTSKTKPDGRTINYVYDALNRLSERIYPNGTSDVFQYDQAGNLVGTTNPYIAYYYSYDSNNRLTGVTSYNLAQIFNIEYQYDNMGNRKTMTFKEGTSTPKVINYEYNINNQMTKITADMGSFTFAYDALGRRIKRTLPNDSYTTYSYDQLSRLTGMTHINAFKQTIDSVSYTHDNVGNRLTKSDSDKTISYNYDLIYRLTKASPRSRTTAQLPEDIVNHHSEAYNYDSAGNRKTGPDKFDAYTYNNANEMLNYSGHPNKGNTYEYDLNGNLIKKTETTQGNAKLITSYAYDDENRLIYVTMAKGAKTKEISFAYDPFGRRISKTIENDELNDDNSTKKTDYPMTTFYIYDEQNIIAEYDQTGKQTATYIHGPNIDEPLAAEIRNTRIYYHADGLGSITTLTNHMGHKVQQYDYDSFGNIKSTPFWIKQPYTYTGREFDYETVLYYYRARYYDPTAGRFVTRDPIKFKGGINQYIYAKNNPLRYLDSYGLWGRDVHYDMTYLIALKFPKLACYADKIASKDQLVDDDERSIWPKYRPWNLKWHFPESGRVNALLNKACSTCKFYDIGGVLHVAQDEIAHAGYDWFHFRTSVDDASKRPAEAEITFWETKTLLMLISNRCDGKLSEE